MLVIYLISLEAMQLPLGRIKAKYTGWTLPSLTLCSVVMLLVWNGLGVGLSGRGRIAAT